MYAPDTPVQVIGAVAAVVAAVFSVLAFIRMRREGEVAEQRHVAQVRPRPVVERSELLPNLEPPGSARVRIGISNAGGAAAMWFAFIQVGEYLFYRRAPVPAHYRTPPGGFEELASCASHLSPTAGDIHREVASYALDAEESPWDVLVGERTGVPVVDYFRQRLEPLGIKVGELDAQGRVSLSK